jgi:hypothetical protein
MRFFCWIVSAVTKGRQQRLNFAGTNPGDHRGRDFSSNSSRIHDQPSHVSFNLIPIELGSILIFSLFPARWRLPHHDGSYIHLWRFRRRLVVG